MYEANKNSNMIKYLTLDKLPLNTTGTIHSLNLDEVSARRLIDLGFVSGNTITPLYKSFLGDPICYKIMNTSIAVRSSTASNINVCLQTGASVL